MSRDDRKPPMGFASCAGELLGGILIAFGILVALPGVFLILGSGDRHGRLAGLAFLGIGAGMALLGALSGYLGNFFTRLARAPGWLEPDRGDPEESESGQE